MRVGALSEITEHEGRAARTPAGARAIEGAASPHGMPWREVDARVPTP